MQSDWRDIIVYMHGGGVRHISDQNPSYDPLHFVILFPRGEPGWEAGIPHVDPKTRPHHSGHIAAFDPRAAQAHVDDEAKEGGSGAASTSEHKPRQVLTFLLTHMRNCSTCKYITALCIIGARFLHRN